MTKSELIKKMSEKHPAMSTKEMHIVVNAILDTIAEALSNGNHVEIRGFGTFSVRVRDPRRARNPKTGSPVEVPPKKIPFFIVGKELKERVNTSAKKVPIREVDDESDDDSE